RQRITHTKRPNPLIPNPSPFLLQRRSDRQQHRATAKNRPPQLFLLLLCTRTSTSTIVQQLQRSSSSRRNPREKQRSFRVFNPFQACNSHPPSSSHADFGGFRLKISIRSSFPSLGEAIRI
ncbi:hypothetical protein AABB24_028588, partial [Solanum stoloniferum]